jgi:hypothetical protein
MQQVRCLPQSVGLARGLLGAAAHAAIVLRFAGAYSIEGTGLKYECAHATELRVANYSLFATFGLAAINEAVLTVLGLRGAVASPSCCAVHRAEQHCHGGWLPHDMVAANDGQYKGWRMHCLPQEGRLRRGSGAS